MTTERHCIEVGGIAVDVHRKAIKNLHVGVYPPDGNVRVAAPERFDDEAIRLAVVSRLSWIRQQRRGFADQTRETPREMVTGESHYFRGKRYRLNVVERPGRSRLHITNNTTLELAVPAGTTTSSRQRALNTWYRRQLRDAIPDLLEQWAPVVGVSMPECRIKAMKTRWGSCSIGAQRVWLNLALIKKPPACLDYIVAHELVHLRERHHTERFRYLMDQCMPDWRVRRDELNRAPLAHDHWDY